MYFVIKQTNKSVAPMAGLTCVMCKYPAASVCPRCQEPVLERRTVQTQTASSQYLWIGSHFEEAHVCNVCMYVCMYVCM